MRLTLLAVTLAVGLVVGCAGTTTPTGAGAQLASAAGSSTVAPAASSPAAPPSPPASSPAPPPSPTLRPTMPPDASSASPPLNQLQSVFGRIEQIPDARGAIGVQSVDCMEFDRFQHWERLVYWCRAGPNGADLLARYAVVRAYVYDDAAGAWDVWDSSDPGSNVLSVQELQLGDAARVWFSRPPYGSQPCSLTVHVLSGNLIAYFHFENWGTWSGDACVGWRPYLDYVETNLASIQAIQP